MSLNFGQGLFPQRSDRSITASFDWYDIAEGTGALAFEFFRTTDSSGSQYNLSSNTGTAYSTVIEQGTTSTPGIAAFEKIGDENWDTGVMKTPRTIKGTAYGRFTWYPRKNGGSGTAEGYFIIRVRKWDGSTETEIANVQTITNTGLSGAGGAGEIANEMVAITIPQTIIKKGEQIRITMEAWMKTIGSGGTANWFMYYGGDPRNRDGTYIVPSGDSSGAVTTRSVWSIPFEIDT